MPAGAQRDDVGRNIRRCHARPRLAVIRVPDSLPVGAGQQSAIYIQQCTGISRSGHPARQPLRHGVFHPAPIPHLQVAVFGIEEKHFRRVYDAFVKAPCGVEGDIAILFGDKVKTVMC